MAEVNDTKVNDINYLYSLNITGIEYALKWAIYLVKDNSLIMSSNVSEEVSFITKGLVVKHGEKGKSIIVVDDPSWLSSDLIETKKYSLYDIAHKRDLELKLRDMLALADCRLRTCVF